MYAKSTTDGREIDRRAPPQLEKTDRNLIGARTLQGGR